MAALRLAAAVVALATAAPAHAETVADWQPYIAQASLRFGVPTAWIEQVIRAESNGQTMLGGHATRSRAGAIGLMQLMPATWVAMRDALHLGSNPDDPCDNILAGTFYLRLMYDRFGYPGLFAAYNAGPMRYAMHLGTGHALPVETVDYLRKVSGVPMAANAPAIAAPRDTLFAVRYPAPSERESAPSMAMPVSLFAVRHEDH